MKKTPLSFKIMIPLFIAVTAVLIFFGVKLLSSREDYLEKMDERYTINAIKPAGSTITFSSEKLKKKKKQ